MGKVVAGEGFRAGVILSLVQKDDFTGERFARVVGLRQRPPAGQLPSADDRASFDQLVSRAAPAPKGVFIYRSHEEANADRERWVIEAIIARKRRG